MVAKNGRKKGKKKGPPKRTEEQIAVEAEALRKAELQKLEEGALTFLARENELREQEEEREEGARVRGKLRQELKERDASIEKLKLELLEANGIINANRQSSISQIQELSIHCESLLNEVSHLRSVDNERRLQHSMEIQERVCEIQKLNDVISELKVQTTNEKKELSEKLINLQSLVEAKQSVIIDTKSESTKKSEVCDECFIESFAKMEKVLHHNSELRDEVRRSKIDQGEATAMVQILHAQLDSHRYQLHEIITDARDDLLRAKDEIMRLRGDKVSLHESLEEKDRQLEELKSRFAAVRHEFQQQLDQISFDSQYLTTEIETMREDSAKALSDLEQTKTKAEEESSRLSIELASVKQKNDDLEAFLRAMRAANEEKLSLLNAQLANGRVTIAKLQRAIADERESRARELASQSREVKRTLDELKRLHAAGAREIAAKKGEEPEEEEAEGVRAPADAGLAGEVSALAKALSSAQLDLWEAKRQVLEAQLGAGEEVRRLRSILDAHFIPYAAAVEADAWQGAPSGKSSEHIRCELAQIEANDWHRTLISNQSETIAQLKIALNKAELAHAQAMRKMEGEIRGLKQAIETIVEDGSREVEALN